MNEDFFIIPKPSKKDGKNVGRYWRLDFHDIEKLIIEKQGFSKNVIRLLKVTTASPLYLSLSATTQCI